MSDTKLSDKGVKDLTGLKKLKYLGIAGTEITNDALVPIGKLSELESLALARTKVSDAGMHDLVGLSKLETLGLANTAVGNPGILVLAPMASLRKLYVKNSAVTPEGKQAFRKFNQKVMFEFP
jgi:hypothetical protein